MDIRGLSYGRIEQLIEAGLIRDAAEPVRPRRATLVELERFAEKSAEQLVDAIEASKQQPLSRLLFGLGIDHVGEIAARELARHFGTMDALAPRQRGDFGAFTASATSSPSRCRHWFARRRQAADRQLRGARAQLRGATGRWPRDAPFKG